jgi:hypothetical protein
MIEWFWNFLRRQIGAPERFNGLTSFQWDCIEDARQKFRELVGWLGDAESDGIDGITRRRWLLRNCFLQTIQVQFDIPGSVYALSDEQKASWLRLPDLIEKYDDERGRVFEDLIEEIAKCEDPERRGRMVLDLAIALHNTVFKRGCVRYIPLCKMFGAKEVAKEELRKLTGVVR